MKALNLGCSYGVQFSPDGTRLAVQSPLAAIGSWEKGALMELNLKEEPE